MLKIGVLGAGHLGKIHLKVLKQTKKMQLMGFYDPDDITANKAEQELDIKKYKSYDGLLNDVDIVDIVTPTLSHYECASKAIKQCKHVFIEKPLTNTVSEAEKLIALVKEANIKFQVGHIERFNPAFVGVQKHLNNPMFIETHRLAKFNPRGTDVSVVLDLMIHDIDVVLSMVNANVKNIAASGVSIVSETPDIANARISFDNGCVANITASRISLKNMRKMRVFQNNAYIAMDFLEKKSEIVKIKDAKFIPNPLALTVDLGNKGKKQITIDKPKIKETNAILTELETFGDAIKNNSKPIVTIEDGYNALKVAHKVLEEIEKNISLYQ